jgi:Fe-Mn family superoxide dismutase
MHVLPELPYGYDDLKKALSRSVMETHHSKHHQIYVDKLNAALKDAPDLLALPVDQLLRAYPTLPENLKKPVRNLGGGHYNHSIFWTFMAPDGGGEPGGELGTALVAKYGSYQAFVDQFSEASLGVFGSGWSWLMPDLSITTTQNQDTPLTEGGPAPILGLDVWEHAYYLDYKHLRADYVKAWWDVVNWKQAEAEYGRQA